MNLSDRDRRALTYLGLAAVLYGLFWLYNSVGSSSSSAKVVAPVQSVDMAEKKLANLRKIAATVPGKETVLTNASAELAAREKNLIKGDTAAQAQAQLLQVLREVARNQTPPLEIKQVELGQPAPFGDAYGIVSVSVTVDCRIDQLVNFLAFLSAQPEIIATDQIRFANANAKFKTTQIRLTISGLVPRKLVPVRKGLAAF